MDQTQSEKLLKDESFINYCLEKNESDILYWQKWINEHPEDQAEITKLKNFVTGLGMVAAQQQAEAQYTLLQQSIKQSSQNVKKLKPYHIFYYAAACVLALIAIGAYFIVAHKTTANNYSYNKKHDVTPGGNNALLVLANGKKIDLTNAKAGLLINEKGISISKNADGQVVYKINPKSNLADKGLVGINTIETPAKGQYMVVLPDGTKVWLNAKTTLKYPEAFPENGREVELNGEGYFEVAHLVDSKTGKRIRFTVKTTPNANGKVQYIEVLGTHFNVNCYQDEPDAVTTLLEGSVKVTDADQKREALLHPGQQLINGKHNFDVVQANTEAAIAWKNGDFVFHEDVSSALRKIARWYDVDVVYLPGAPQHLMLGGWISRKNNLSDVLNMIEATGKVHLKLEGRRVLVTE
ncbi:FecR family protein [Mucilaginibacter sp. KACC 22063]|uniref:FecR family protein n=1 Tax=Mucilaginibacter sp. KACC 22063 TaxID=3025666 RepID=UPI00236703A6|nr:FecR family protein [Mucilaginibacter sp. KACC 22063]WDF57339.1 FecR family protein [Mucilaginibacter sp. KACC 22063]